MFRAIGRWFKAMGYLLTGQIDAARESLDTNPKKIKAQYDSIVRDKLDQIQTYKKADLRVEAALALGYRSKYSAGMGNHHEKEKLILDATLRRAATADLIFAKAKNRRCSLFTLPDTPDV